MKQPEDRRTLDWVGEKARMVNVCCRACPYTAQLVLQSGEGAPQCPRCGRLWLAEVGPVVPAQPIAPAGRGRKPGQRCGAYQGAVKIGSENMRARAKTGKTQAEFAALCGISERTLRTWEATGDVSQATGRQIMAQLHALTAPANPQRRAVAYRDPMTGSTWSGRGLMPAWLKVELNAKGRRLSEFVTGA